MKLYIIGNGFDISHGIPSKYSDFRNYLKENREDIIRFLEKFYYTGNNSELWTDFERSLEEDINYNIFSEIIGESAPNIASDEFKDRDWNTAQIDIDRECNELLENIRSGFEEWINSLNVKFHNVVDDINNPFGTLDWLPIKSPEGVNDKKVDYFCFTKNKNNYATNLPFQCKNKFKYSFSNSKQFR